MDERKKREFDPTERLIRECIAEARQDRKTDTHTEQKLRELAVFFETTTAWYDQIRLWPAGALTRFIKAGDKVRKLLGSVQK
jgi:DNA-binding transcriptional regulator GbsR (MarR family)